MFHLMRSEIARFRGFALAFAVAHLLVLRFSMSFYPLFAQDQAKMAVGLLIYALLGLIFGLYQITTYRRPHLWTWLVNRPLEPHRIFLALASAAAALALGVIVLPLFVMTVYADVFSAQWVDARHYLTTPFVAGLVLCFYFLGAFIAASPRRASVLTAALAIFFLTREAPGAWIFVPLLIVLCWLAYLAYSAFRPDLSSPEKRRTVLVASALPIAYALFWIMMGSIATIRSIAIIVYEHGPTGFSTFAWNDYWDEGHVMHVGYLDEQQAMAHGLRLAAQGESEHSERARSFSQQIDLADVYEPMGPRFARFPQRHQLFFIDHRHKLVDEEGEVRWTFSHDVMRFSGQHLRTDVSVGFMGSDGSIAERVGDVPVFDVVPSIVDSRWLVFPHHIDEIDFKLRRMQRRFELPEGERMVMPFRIHRSYATVLSDRRFYLFEARSLELEKGPVEPMLTLDLPGLDRNLDRIQVAEMLDSYLVSLVYGAQSFRGFHEARQLVFELDLSGETQMIGDVALAPGFPDWYRRRGFVLSPFLQHAHDLVWTAIGPQREQRVEWGDIVSRPVPKHILAAAAATTLLSALLTWSLLVHRRLAPKDRRFWVVMSLLLGLPGALASWLLTVRDEAADMQDVTSTPRALALATKVASIWGER